MSLLNYYYTYDNICVTENKATKLLIQIYVINSKPIYQA